MQLRNLTIPYAQPAVFAPMAGFTDAACRHLMADHGAAWTVSEMASAKAITFGDDKSVRLLRDKASHGIYAVQLFGAEPETMAQAIRIIQEKGVQFDILDINMGCPAPKITSSGAGSKLMQDPELCGRMVAAARGALGPDKPLTVKMRIGWDAEQLTGVAVARQCEANGADLIAVHGRTREQMYIPPIDVDAITEVRKAVGIPVLANGDITTAEGAKQILEQTGCAGVMIGRGMAEGIDQSQQVVNRSLDRIAAGLTLDGHSFGSPLIGGVTGGTGMLCDDRGQTATQTALLEQLLAALVALHADIPTMLQALGIELDGREVGRLVRKYANA